MPIICLVTENGDIYIVILKGHENIVSKIKELSNIRKVYPLGKGVNSTIIACDTYGKCYDLSKYVKIITCNKSD